MNALQNIAPALTMSSREIAELANEFAKTKVRRMAEKGFVYYVALSSGLLKVGHSKRDPRSRILAHANTARVAMAEVKESRVFEVYGPSVLEAFLIAELSKSCKSVTREWFSGATPEQVEAILSAWQFDEGHELVRKGREVLAKASASMDERFASLVGPERGRHGHVWSECRSFASALAKRAAHDVPEFYTKFMDGAAITRLELVAWITAYESSADSWIDLALVAEESPGDFVAICERTVSEMLLGLSPSQEAA